MKFKDGDVISVKGWVRAAIDAPGGFWVDFTNKGDKAALERVEVLGTLKEKLTPGDHITTPATGSARRVILSIIPGEGGQFDQVVHQGITDTVSLAEIAWAKECSRLEKPA